MISVADLIRHRLQTERFVQRQSEGCLRTEFGDFKTIVYASTILSGNHLALVHGEIAGRENVLVRMHSHCIYGDVFGSVECQCHQLMRKSLRADRRGRRRRAGLSPSDRPGLPQSRELRHTGRPEAAPA